MFRALVVAHPGARRERVELLADDSLGVWVLARPVESQANEAIERALAAALRLRRNQVRVTSGQRSRRKIVEIDLPDVPALRERLVAHAVRSS
jgi:uncharacterized protein YggU (UPF0235/DUF167 family)